jgi:hypothetical protein
MILLKVPFSEKDKAKALGARWNSERKAWYVPDGKDITPFKQWHTASESINAPSPALGSVKKMASGVNEHTGKLVVGEHYIELNHDCSPFIECLECKPLLDASGWITSGKAMK